MPEIDIFDAGAQVDLPANKGLIFNIGTGPVQFNGGRTFLFEPVTHGPSAYDYAFDINLDAFFTRDGAALKSYGLYVHGDRDSGYAITGDSNDALFRLNGNNYAANDANFIWRGLNCSVANRSGGTLGLIEHNISAQNKSGGTSPTVRGLTVTAENYGTCATEMGAADFVIKNEGAAPTLTYGIRIRSLDSSGVSGAVGSAINISTNQTTPGKGFTQLIDASGATLTEYDTATKVILMKFKAADGADAWLVHDTDAATVLAVTASQPT